MNTKVYKIQIDNYLIPIMEIKFSAENKNIISIPTQIGCFINCKFCPSSKNNFVRNLTTTEMIYLVNQIIDKNKNTLISLTGEGEGILNYKNVNNFLIYFDSFNYIKEFRICFSGFKSSNLNYIINNLKTPLDLQFSLISPFDNKRNSFIENTDLLSNIFKNINSHENKNKFNTISINYVLIDDFNDSIDDLNELLQIIDNDWIIKLNPFIENNRIKLNDNLNVFFDKLKKNHKNVLKFNKIGSSLNNKIDDLTYEKIS
jgi:23S rRNA (adenine2503-C2)-methyltransferase